MQSSKRLLSATSRQPSGPSTAMPWTTLQRCGVVGLLCSALNLFADLCFMDFYFAHFTFEGLGTIDRTSREGNLFDFDAAWPLQLAQASGWMYPVWALATAYPLYVGLHGAGWWCSVAPCATLAYGLCIVGGNLHSGFAFATILPQVLHTPHLLKATKWKPMAGSPACVEYMQAAQVKLMDAWVFGYTPGPQAVMLASVWIAYVVVTRETRFPRWFILFTPLVTVAWVVAVGLFVLPDPWGTYFAGTFGTWIIFFLNLATFCILWNANEQAEFFRRLH